jgi:hypothetical protein
MLNKITTGPDPCGLHLRKKKGFIRCVLILSITTTISEVLKDIYKLILVFI